MPAAYRRRGDRRVHRHLVQEQRLRRLRHQWRHPRLARDRRRRIADLLAASSRGQFRARWTIAEVDQPVHLPGLAGSPVAVKPGDFLLGDADGVIVIPPRSPCRRSTTPRSSTPSSGPSPRRSARAANREQLFVKHPRFKHIKRLRP